MALFKIKKHENDEELFKKEIDDFCNNINAENFEISNDFLDHIIDINSYKKIENYASHETYYSETNKFDLPNFFRTFELRNQKKIVLTRAWTYKKIENFFYHNIEALLEFVVPSLHRENKPAFIQNPIVFSTPQKYENVNVFYAQNGVLHSNFFPAIYYEEAVYFYLFGGNKTKTFIQTLGNDSNVTLSENNFNINLSSYKKMINDDQNYISKKWQLFSSMDKISQEIELFKSSENMDLNRKVLELFYQKFTNSNFIFYSLINESNFYDLPNIIVIQLDGNIRQKIWKNSKGEYHRDPKKPALITYKDNLINEDYYINDININQFSPNRKEYASISELFEP